MKKILPIATLVLAVWAFDSCVPPRRPPTPPRPPKPPHALVLPADLPAPVTPSNIA